MPGGNEPVRRPLQCKLFSLQASIQVSADVKPPLDAEGLIRAVLRDALTSSNTAMSLLGARLNEAQVDAAHYAGLTGRHHPRHPGK